MSEQATAAPAAGESISLRDAAAQISAPVEQTENIEAEAPETAAEPPQESAPEADAGPAEEPVPGETEEADPAAEQPSIEPPRSWSKEHKEHFETLPRHIQQAIADNERAREADFHQKTRDAAEQRRAMEARVQAADHARVQYEQMLPVVMANMNAEFQREFGNPTTDEVDRWSRDEPEKWVRFNAASQKLHGVAGQMRQADANRKQAFLSQAKAYVDHQDKLFREKVPEWFADAGTTAKKQGEMVSFMEESGFARSELKAYADMAQPMSVHDHRLQLIFRDAMEHRAAKKAVAKAAKTAPKQVPPVQRPGPATSKGDARTSRQKDLETNLGRSGSLRDAARLISARLAS